MSFIVCIFKSWNLQLDRKRQSEKLNYETFFLQTEKILNLNSISPFMSWWMNYKNYGYER